MRNDSTIIINRYLVLPDSAHQTPTHEPARRRLVLEDYRSNSGGYQPPRIAAVASWETAAGGRIWRDPSIGALYSVAAEVNPIVGTGDRIVVLDTLGEGNTHHIGNVYPVHTMDGSSRVYIRVGGTTVTVTEWVRARPQRMSNSWFLHGIEAIFDNIYAAPGMRHGVRVGQRFTHFVRANNGDRVQAEGWVAGIEHDGYDGNARILVRLDNTVPSEGINSTERWVWSVTPADDVSVLEAALRTLGGDTTPESESTGVVSPENWRRLWRMLAEEVGRGGVYENDLSTMAEEFGATDLIEGVEYDFTIQYEVQVDAGDLDSHVGALISGDLESDIQESVVITNRVIVRHRSLDPENEDAGALLEENSIRDYYSERIIEHVEV